jgi:hypothetical protein
VIYVGGSTHASKVLADGRLQKYFSRAGHRVTVARDEAALADALQSAPVDVIIAGLTEALGIYSRVDAVASKPTLLPVESENDRTATSHQFTATLKESDHINGFLAKVEAVMKNRPSTQARRSS